jgi:ribosomal protein S21
MRNPFKNKKIEKITNKIVGPQEVDENYFSPIQIIVGNNFERAFKAFRSLVQSEKILSIFKEKQSYEKPSDKKRRKHNETMRRNYEDAAKQKKILSGEYEKEKVKKQAKKEKRMKERSDKNYTNEE